MYSSSEQPNFQLQRPTPETFSTFTCKLRNNYEGNNLAQGIYTNEITLSIL